MRLRERGRGGRAATVACGHGNRRHPLHVTIFRIWASENAHLHKRLCPSHLPTNAIRPCKTADIAAPNGPNRAPGRPPWRHHACIVIICSATCSHGKQPMPACLRPEYASIQMGFLPTVIVNHPQLAALGIAHLGRLGGEIGLYLVPQIEQSTSGLSRCTAANAAAVCRCRSRCSL